MERMIRTLMICVCALSCTSAQASNWIWVGTSGDNTTIEFIDTTTIRINNLIRSVWNKKTFKRHSSPDPAEPHRYWKTALVLATYNCATHVWRQEASTIYFEDGGAYSEPESHFPTAWAHVRPDSSGEAIMKRLCVDLDT